MVVAIINEDCVFAFKREGKPPVAADHNRPVTFQFPMEGMQLPAGSVHVLHRSGIVEHEELFTQPFAVTSLNFCFRPGPEEQFDSLMTKAFDHSYSV